MNEQNLFDITIYAGADYILDLVYEEDDDTPTDVTGWTVEATLREFHESNNGIDFYCTANENGFHVQMSNKLTEEIGYAHGFYDVFIIDPNNNIRVKLISGRAFIKARTIR